MLEGLTLNAPGSTMTHALSPDSPAIDAGDSTVCPGEPVLNVDQRGVTRPIDGNGDTTAECDIGAYELEPPATPSPSPTPSATPTGEPTPTPTGEPTPTPTSPTPTVTSTGEPTPTPDGETLIWGDNNCEDGPNPVDGLITLRFDAGLSANTGDCPAMGEEVDVAEASSHLWGDVDCDGAVGPIDSLKLLRFDAGLSVSQEPGCPEIGDEVIVTA